MASHHRKAIYQDLPIENPMKKNEKIYCDLIAKESKGKRSWTIVSFVQLVVILVLTGFIGYAVNLPRKIPVVITVLPWGEAKYVGDVSSYSYETMKIPDAAYIYQVETFIQRLRTLPSDGDVLTDNISSLYNMITPEVERTMTPAIRSDNPFANIGFKKRIVTIESTIRVSGSTYQVDYIETLSGRESGSRRYRALVTVGRKTPPKDAEKLNPLGIYISDYNITELTHIQGVK
jgi:type IV secretion system protein VirB5